MRSRATNVCTAGGVLTLLSGSKDILAAESVNGLPQVTVVDQQVVCSRAQQIQDGREPEPNADTGPTLELVEVRESGLADSVLRAATEQMPDSMRAFDRSEPGWQMASGFLMATRLSFDCISRRPYAMTAV